VTGEILNVTRSVVFATKEIVGKVTSRALHGYLSLYDNHLLRVFWTLFIFGVNEFSVLEVATMRCAKMQLN